MLPEDLDAHIQRLIDQAPPLNDHQRAKLAALLRPPATAEVKPDQVVCPAVETRREAA